MESTDLHVAIISSPGMGHRIPTLLLGNRLLSHHNLYVTILFLTTDTSPAESQLLHSNSGSKHLNIIKIPLLDISNITLPDDKLVTKLVVLTREARTDIHAAIFAMNPRPNVLIADTFSTEVWPIAEEFGMAKYAFFTSCAWSMALAAYCHILDGEVEGQYVDQKESLRIPGCKPIKPEDVPEPMSDRSNQEYREFTRIGKDFTQYDGVLVNTWEDLESMSLHALRHNEVMRSVFKVPVYPIGPLTRPAEPASSKNDVIEWLDMQPRESVVYVSFGSGGTLLAEQIKELAWGLELSQQRFVWVVRPPNDAATDASFFTVGGNSTVTSSYFPDGFLERNSKMGLVIQQWASQVEILSHQSVGGFVSHSGWNSILESIACELPMIAWPLYAEQIMNATMLTEELKISVRPKVLPRKEVVGREEIKKMIRTLMEGNEQKEMRENVKKLKKSGEEALSTGGSSYNSMCEVIKHLRLKIQHHKANDRN